MELEIRKRREEEKQHLQLIKFPFSVEIRKTRPFNVRSRNKSSSRRRHTRRAINQSL